MKPFFNSKNSLVCLIITICIFNCCGKANSSIDDNKMKKRDIKLLRHETQRIKFTNSTEMNHNNGNSSSAKIYRPKYGRCLLFIPIVLIILILTIVSISGFIVFFLNNYTSINRTPLDVRSIINSHLRYLEFKKNNKKKKKHRGYKKEPEPELSVFN